MPDSSAILTANGKNVISKAWDNRPRHHMVSQLAQALSGQELRKPTLCRRQCSERIVPWSPMLQRQIAGLSSAVGAPRLVTSTTAAKAIGDGTLIRFFDPGHLMLPYEGLPLDNC